MCAATASRRAPGADVGRSALREGLLRREAWVWSERLSSEARLRGVQLSPHLAEPSPAGLRAAPRSARAAPRHRPPRASALRPEHTQTRGHSRLHCFWQTARNNCPSTRDYSESGHSKHLLPGRKRETSYGQGQTDVLPRALLPAGSAVKYAGLAAGVQMWTHQIYKKTNQ